MPIKSKAQRRKFAELLVEGKIEPETFEKWNREAGGAELPERVGRKRAKKTARKAKSSARKAKGSAKKARKAKKR
jgi:hypothetical protein